jgi:hypothetical protein
MAAGIVLIVSVVSDLHPVLGNVYVTKAVPADRPVTTPDKLPTVNIPVPEVLHMPPGVASYNVAAAPEQRCPLPPISPGNGLTVKAVVDIQPDGSIYVTVAVPGVVPFTLPKPPPRLVTVASELKNNPVAGTSLMFIVSPYAQILCTPDIGATLITDTPCVTTQPDGAV